MITTDDGIAIVRAVGDLDMRSDTASQRRLLDQAATAWGLVADLLDVPFADSAGLDALVRAHVACTANSGQFAIATRSESILRVMDVTGYGDVLHITGSVDEACVELRRLAGLP